MRAKALGHRCSWETRASIAETIEGSARVLSRGFLGAQARALLQVCQREAAGACHRPAFGGQQPDSEWCPDLPRHSLSHSHPAPSVPSPRCAGEAGRRWGLGSAPVGSFPLRGRLRSPGTLKPVSSIHVNTLGPSPGPRPVFGGMADGLHRAPAVQRLWSDSRRRERHAGEECRGREERGRLVRMLELLRPAFPLSGRDSRQEIKGLSGRKREPRSQGPGRES